MSVFALSLNHHTAPVDLRGRFAFTLEQIPAALHGLRQGLHKAAPEAALLSTCNRTELYIAAGPGDSRALVRPTLEWLAAHGNVSADELVRHTHVLERQEAARHAFRVASGLDSMVLGEAQILGQMKQAVREADTAGTLGFSIDVPGADLVAGKSRRPLAVLRLRGAGGARQGQPGHLLAA